MRILILVDILNDWALHNRAKVIKKMLPQHTVEIRGALDDKNGCLSGHETFDVIHFNFTWGITHFTNFALTYSRKCVFTVVNERSFTQNAGVNPEQLLAIFSRAKYKTAVNRRMAKMISGVYIPNGIDEDLFPNVRAPIVGYSGTDMPNKKVNVVKKACDDLGLEFRAAIYRRGDNAARKPDFRHDEMFGFYSMLDVFVHCSETEGFSNTVLEALACNVPVLMTRQGAWQEFDGWVEFIEPDVEDVKRALQKFTGRRIVDDKFLWKNIVPQYEAIYQTVYENSKRF